MKKKQARRAPAFKIERNIPIPEQRRPEPKHERRPKANYPIGNMKVGDSFYIRRDPNADDYMKWNPAAGVSSVLARYRRMGWKFTQRSDAKGVRLWRTK